MEEQEKQEQTGYTPRPAWQVWAARIGLVIAIGFVIAQFLHMATFGL